MWSWCVQEQFIKTRGEKEARKRRHNEKRGGGLLVIKTAWLVGGRVWGGQFFSDFNIFRVLMSQVFVI